MGRGLGVWATTSARSWGCAGLVALVVAACAAPPGGPDVAADELHLERAVLPVIETAHPEASPTLPAGAPAVAPPPVPAPEPGAIAPPPERFDGPPPRPAPAPRFGGGARAGGTWAVIIGIDDYPGRRNDLRYAKNDADDADRLLARLGVAPERRVRLSDGQATAANIRRAADWLVDRAGPDATVVFFYAGHVRRLGGGREAIVAADGVLVGDADLARRFATLQARRGWFVFASCFGGGFTELLAPGRILTAAAPADRLAYESVDLRRSYLGEYLFRQALLGGRTPPTVERAFAWAEAAIRREHPNRVPVQFDHHDGELHLGPLAPPAAAPAAASPPAAGSAGGPPPTTTTTAPPKQEERSCGFTMGTLIHCPDRGH